MLKLGPPKLPKFIYEMNDYGPVLYSNHHGKCFAPFNHLEIFVKSQNKRSVLRKIAYSRITQLFPKLTRELTLRDTCFWCVTRV